MMTTDLAHFVVELLRELAKGQSGVVAPAGSVGEVPFSIDRLELHIPVELSVAIAAAPAPEALRILVRFPDAARPAAERQRTRATLMLVLTTG
ncbi:hypothetical protein WME76_24505 [Sorangium sp. So ce119]|uniref:hypothetical protein n=1 Tax=Sorangium sp. So ce119 TaxID=3133279 RepID=UPI003F5E8FE3